MPNILGRGHKVHAFFSDLEVPMLVELHDLTPASNRKVRDLLCVPVGAAAAQLNQGSSN